MILDDENEDAGYDEADDDEDGQDKNGKHDPHRVLLLAVFTVVSVSTLIITNLKIIIVLVL